MKLKQTYLFLFLTALIVPTTFAKTIVDDDLDIYVPGTIADGGTSSAIDPWFSFSSSGSGSPFRPSVKIQSNTGANGTKCLKISAGVRPETQKYFFVGARRTFTANLNGLDLSKIKLTAKIRTEVKDKGSPQGFVLPDNFHYQFRLESVNAEGLRGQREFLVKGLKGYASVGGILSEAISGIAKNYPDIEIVDGRGDYQIVVAVSSSNVGFPFAGGNYDLDIYVDDIKLEILDNN